MPTEADKEKIIQEHGYRKLHGYKIYNDMICGEYDNTYVPMDEVSGTLEERDYWMSKDGACFDTVDDVLEYLDLNMELEDEYTQKVRK